MNKESFINELSSLGAKVSIKDKFIECVFDTSEKSTLELVANVYVHGGCVIGVRSKSEPELDLAFQAFESMEYENNEELYYDALKLVRDSLQNGVKCNAKKGLINTTIQAVFVATGKNAFGGTYFKYSGFKLPKKSGIVGVLVSSTS